MCPTWFHQSSAFGLLRTACFQVAVGMALVLLIGSLGRVMIVEPDGPASLVGTMIGSRLIFAPSRALIGFHSDTHRSELGWKRVAFMCRGTLVQFGGLASMPFALLVFARPGSANGTDADRAARRGGRLTAG